MAAGLVRGETLANGFVVVEAREARLIRRWDGTLHEIPGHFELARELPGGGFVRFTASSAAKVAAQATSWIEAQSRRKDGGHLRTAKPRVVQSGMGVQVVAFDEPKGAA